jgi:hypothetical protein
MSQSQQLLPSLYALLPPSLHQRIIAHLSLQSLHIEPYNVTDTIYLPTNPVIPQYRTLRLRSTYTGGSSQTDSNDNDGIVTAEGTVTKNSASSRKKSKRQRQMTEKHELSYVSNSLNGREYADVDVRAVLGVEVMGGCSSLEEIQEFIEGLGFK